MIYAIGNNEEAVRLSGHDVAFAAVVISGTILAGGKGSLIGTFLGACIMGVLNNGLLLLGMGDFFPSDRLNYRGYGRTRYVSCEIVSAVSVKEKWGGITLYHYQRMLLCRNIIVLSCPFQGA